MKKAIANALIILMAFTFLAACAADFAPALDQTAWGGFEQQFDGTVLGLVNTMDGASRASRHSAPAFAPAPPPPAASAPVAEAIMDIEIWDSPEPDQTEIDSAAGIGAGGESGFAERIIYTASADIETLDFDATIESVHEKLRFHGGFIESSFVSGRNQWQIQFGGPGNRIANFTLRVPQERLAIMTEGLEVLGNVVSLRNEAINITAQFVDTESRLLALRIQEERLLYMLRLADNVADMIIIEQSLSDVRVNIESMTATLRNWENQINFSTLELFIFEVEEFTEFVPPVRTVWHRVGDQFAWAFSDMGWIFIGIITWFIAYLPALALFAGIIFVAQLIIRKTIKKIRAKRHEAQPPPPADGTPNAYEGGKEVNVDS